MCQSLVRFVASEDGSVAVEWVAFTALALVLGIAGVHVVYGTGVAGAVAAIEAPLGAIAGDSPHGEGTDGPGAEGGARSGPGTPGFAGGGIERRQSACVADCGRSAGAGLFGS